MITKGLEDYIEYIYLALSQNQTLRAIDIANHFNISRASVSEMLIKLCEKELIIYEGRKGIIITDLGIIKAKKIIKKHNILLQFFSEVLGANHEDSSLNACKIEHVIDENLVEKIEKFSNFCIKNKINEKFESLIKNDK